MQDWVLAYAAGVIDGEGCISANRSTNQLRQKNPCYRIQVRVTNTNPRMITFLYDHFGGSIQIRETTRRTIYQWGMFGDNAILFLKLIKQYIQCKKEELETALLLSTEHREEIKASLCDKLSTLKKTTIRIEEVS